MNKNTKIMFIILLSLIVITLAGFGIKSYFNLQEEQEELKEEIKDLKEDKKEEDENEETTEENNEVTKAIVPNLAGMTMTEVYDALAKMNLKGLSFKIESLDSNYSPDTSIVVKTEPSVGEEIKAGETIILYLSNQTKKILIEDYVGKDYRVVKAQLEEKGLVVSVEKTDIDNADSLDDNVIVFQDRFSGEELNPGDKITLMIPNKAQIYPDFTSGYSLDDVQAFCDANGITLKVEFTQDSGYESGAIFYQSRNAGYKVVSGTSLSIKVAK